ncbi:MAG: DUF4417 domain-containing protein [Bacilli bacterium]|nr:DUF4417 domain-containing protein [Bacilli bacterium]
MADYNKYFDGFNPELVKGAKLTKKYHIPILLHQELEMPKSLVAFDKRNIVGDKNQTIHFYIKDERFQQMINHPDKYIDVLKEYESVISMDPSLYRDAPMPIELINVYLNRAIAYYMQTKGIKVIPNIRWGRPDSFDYCFLGVEKHSIVSIGTLGCIQGKENKYYFELGLNEMINRLQPKVVIVYGRFPNEVFEKFKDRTKFIHFSSEYEESRRKEEQ